MFERCVLTVRVAHLRQPDCAQEDNIGGARSLLGTRSDVPAGFLKISGSCMQVMSTQAKPANPLTCRINDGKSGVGDIDADAVTFYNGNFIAGLDHEER